jgi:hypothetical protein
MFNKTLTAACVAACLATTATGIARADESTTISSKAFVDLTNIDQTSDGKKTAASGTGVDVKRLYIGVGHSFDDVWSVQGTTDFNYSSTTSETQVYIKKAYLQAKLSDAFTARLGSADLPWVPLVEDLYGYLYVEKVLVDRLKFGTSADWGLHTLGKVADGQVSYAVSVLNGNGYKNPTRTKSMDFEGRISYAPIDGVTLAAGYYTGKLGKDVQGALIAPYHTAQRFDALATYVKSGLRVGAEYFSAKDWANVLTPASDKADGYSLWASYNITPMWGVFARGDSAKPSKDLAPNRKDQYYNAGVVAHPRKNVDVAFVYKTEKASGGGSINTGNGLIGGVTEGKYNEIGVWAQVSF